MTPLTRLATLAGAGALVLAGCGASDETGSLIIGSDLTYPPYAYLDGDEPAGFDPAIMRALAAEMDQTPEFRDTRFEQLIPSLDAGHIAVIASALYITADRAEEVDFIPYFSTGNSIVVAEGSDPITDAGGLCGLTVAVIKGGDVVTRLRDEASGECTDAGRPPIDVREFGTDPEGTQALLSGQVDAQVTDAAVAATLADREGPDVEITSTELLYPIPVGLAVRKGDDELRQRLKDALNILQEDGTYDELLAEYNLAPVDEDQVRQILGEQ